MWNTSVSFPQSDSPLQDTAGFVTHDKTYLHGIPASRKDATRQDELLAYQYGYTVSRTYEVDAACYNGAGFLIDEFEQKIYDIKRVYHPEKSDTVVLTCEVRDRGKI